MEVGRFLQSPGFLVTLRIMIMQIMSKIAKLFNLLRKNMKTLSVE